MKRGYENKNKNNRIKKQETMKVCKFGGTSVGSVERMKNVANLISDDHPKIVVLSATAGTTDHLEKIVSYIFNREIDEAHNEITKLEFYFVDFANKLLKDDCIKRQAIDHILDRFRLLWNFTATHLQLPMKKKCCTRRTHQYSINELLFERTKKKQCTPFRFRLYAYRPRW